MADAFRSISDDLAAWIRAQPVYFVATAPSGPGGHVNVSPKGLDTLAVLGPNRVAYLDLTGSGAETIAHLRDNGRITIMLCAFEGAPRICRIYGRGTPHHLGSDAFAELAGEFPAYPGMRAVVDVAVERVSTSCGYGVPLMAYTGERDDLVDWAVKRGEDGLVGYRARKNARSIDGLDAWPLPATDG